MELPDPKYGLGLAPDVNRLANYNALWPVAFSEEAVRIKTALGDRVLAIEHYGSTAVPGLLAKPIIDLLMGVADIDDGLRFIEPMANLGYDYVGNRGIAEHHIFGRGREWTHLVHVVVYEGQQWFRCLRFRDRLRASLELRTEYALLKQRLVKIATSRAEYTAGKTDFVERVCGLP